MATDTDNDTGRPMVGYCRVSTGAQARSGLGLDAQRAKVEAWAAPEARPFAIIEDPGVSGSKPFARRPGGREALRRLRTGEACGLVAPSLSRLGRSTADILSLAETADSEGWTLVVLDLGLDTSTPVGRFTLTALAAVAQLERDLASERTTEALAEARRKGVQLGKPASPRVLAAGRRALELRADGMTWAAVIDALHSEGHRPEKADAWSLTTVRRAAGYAERADTEPEAGP